MITEPSQFSLIHGLLPSYSVASVTVQLQKNMGRINPGNEAKSVTYTMTATIVVTVARETNRITAGTVKN